MVDVFIVGGGPAGLAAAIEARRKGFDVLVADAAVPPIDKACGEGLMPDGLRALRRLGVQFDGSDCFPFRGIRFLDEGSGSVAAMFPEGDGFGVRRTTLHRLLVDQARACGVRTLWGTPITGIAKDGVQVGDRLIRAKWIVGADGGNSRVRRWTGLGECARLSLRYGFRRHYEVAPWSSFMEIYWGSGCQIYTTPVSSSEVCVALISPDSKLRLDQALPHFPNLQARLAGAAISTVERGAITASRKLKRVYKGNVVLLGDASGSVDAITGEGLCLSFQQAATLADCLVTGDLRRYQSVHRRLARRPSFMASFMLALGTRTRLRRRALRALSSDPKIFANMVAMHVGALSPMVFAANGIALGWQMLTA